MIRRRTVKRFAVVLAGMLVLAAVSAYVVVRSQWFFDKVRTAIISTVEDATGGRVEIGSLSLDWKTLRAEVQTFVLHGTEPPEKPPLFRATSVAVGLKIVSLLKRDVDIQYLDVVEPRVYLVVNPDGSTNVPQPRIKSQRDENAVETLIKLAIGRFSLQNGYVEVEARGRTPIDVRGQNLSARLTYDPLTPRYRGDLSIQPLSLHWSDYDPVPFGVSMSVSLEKNRIGFEAAKVTTGETQIGFSGAIEDLAAPHGKLQYDVRTSLRDVARILRVPELERGTAQVGGTAVWSGGSNLSATGNLHAFGVDYRDSTIRLRGGQLDGSVRADLQGVEVDSARLSTTYVTSLNQMPIGGRIGTVALHGRVLELRGVALAAIGGTFRGDARLLDWIRYSVNGDITGIEAKPIVAMYSREPLPWNGKASGPVRVSGSLRRKAELRVQGDLVVAPAPASAPVHGEIHAAYEAREGTLDLGRSTLTLPASRVDFSGIYGREVQVHVETRDLNDFLPILGTSAAALPVKLENGRATFNGIVSGPLEHPQLAGHVSATDFSVQGKLLRTFEADAIASPENIRSQNAIVTRGSLRAQFQAAVRLDDWKAGDDSEIFGSGTIRNGDLKDVLELLDLKTIPLTGTLSGGAQISGTIAKPIVAGDIELTKGFFREEPFDRFTGNVHSSADTISLSTGRLAAGAKQLTLAASFSHDPNRLDTGRLHFQVNSNAMSLEQIKTLQENRPGLRGTVDLNGSGDLDLAPDAKDEETVRVAGLHVDINARSLQFSGQELGDARLTANSEGQVLRAMLEAKFADTAVKGAGQFRLEGDYPGSATITFSKLDLSQVRAWLSSGPGAADRFAGSVEGELRINGPLLKSEEIRAELRLPTVEIGPTPQAGVPAGLALHNSGPIVVTMANSVVTVNNARMTGRATDLTVGGKVSFQQKNPLDLRINGKVDLALVQEFNRDLTATGSINLETAVRGEFDSPQINGRVQFQKAAMSLLDFPLGLSNASGAINFSGDRATIQNLSGEIGGGKVEVTGFAGLGAGPAVFRLHAAVNQVRIRYPEGVSTVADASLDLTGSTDRSTLAGTITVLRAGFNPQSDFSSLIAKSAEPVQTPSARTGFLGGLNFDVQVATAPDIQFQSSLTQDIQVEANLQLRGTATNPAIVGRVNITQGQVVFYGTRYTVNQGTIAFFNPLKIDPILDVDLETKARGIDVTLSVTGPLNKLNLTPRSDPPLQFNEIVALLATGRAPTSDPTMLAQQNTAPQSWQQMGASALLGQAIASPVAGRLQRFFGVSKLRIDPTLPGVENNPQARLTLEQQISPDVTFTYITNVTNSNPQVIRIEWALSKQLSVILLREENGVFGLDFFVKRRF